MQIDVRVRNPLEVIGDDARSAEELGADGILNAEIEEDPFPGLALAAARTERVAFGPAVAVAFARSPTARMKEFVSALHAIWHSWDTGEPLVHDGEFYTHTLMTPMMSPTRNAYGPPKVFLAAVGPQMLRVAGEVADGLFPHAFMTERYLREVVVPTLREGQRVAGRPDDAVEIA